MKTLLFCILAAGACACGAEPVWTFRDGGEFPGAKGSLAATNGCLTLSYDFTSGGHYVAAWSAFEKPQAFREIALAGEWGPDTDLTVRFGDATGQSFQKRIRRRGDGFRNYFLELSSFPAHWGGAKDGVVHQPIKNVMLIAENLLQRSGGPVGKMRIRNVRFCETTYAERVARKRPDRPFPELMAEARRLERRLAAETASLEAKGLGAKARASLATLGCFFRWIDEDVRRGFDARAHIEAAELVGVATNALARNARVRAGLEEDAPQPRFVTSSVVRDGVKMLATRQWPDGRRERGPVFLTGYGHFSGVQNDLEILPSLGNNILQMEIGPQSVLTGETTLEFSAYARFHDIAARAARANVQICLLLSPHYFPKWALAKWPDLAECKGGFFGYCVHDPRAQGLIEKYLRTVIPLVRGNPALHSVCLSNEPEQGFWGAHCPLRREFPGYLRAQYGTIAALNAAWGTAYADFTQVDVPEHYIRIPETPAALAFLRFSRERFAAFHRRMADVVRELAPELPVHSKIMIGLDFQDSATFRSVDPERFARLSDYNGNDCADYHLFGMDDDWSHGWWTMEAGYDYQRSAADKPIFNTENHIVGDREIGAVPADHFYAVLWQNALHGQAATTLWTWQRAYDKGKSDFNGLILERPLCFDAWARCALDLNRLADAIVPIQEQAPEIVVHRSVVSSALDHHGADPFLACYRAASFFGAGVGVCSDEMLARTGREGARMRPFAAARVVLLPQPIRLTDAARAGLGRLAAAGVTVVACGALPLKDTFGAARRAEAMTLVRATEDRKLFEELRRGVCRAAFPGRPGLTGEDGLRGVWGVETHGYEKDGRLYLTAVNHLRNAREITLPAEGRDLLTGARLPARLRLAPEHPVFLRGN